MARNRRWDSALSSERTALSWQRSVGSLAVVAALALRGAAAHGALWIGLGAALVILAPAVLAWTVGSRRYSATIHPPGEPSPSVSPRATQALAVATCGIAVVAIAVTLTLPADPSAR